MCVSFSFRPVSFMIVKCVRTYSAKLELTSFFCWLTVVGFANLSVRLLKYGSWSTVMEWQWSF